MSRLFFANLMRLAKSKIFWLLNAGIFAWGATAYVLLFINTREYDITEFSLNPYFFNYHLFLGCVMAIFAGFYIGIEYSDGTLRNKLALGHTRRNIYLSNLLIVLMVGVIFTIAYIAAAFLVGMPLVGTEIWSGLQLPLRGLLITLPVICVYGAISTLLSMLDSNKARAVLVSLLLSLLLFAVGFIVLNGLAQPEFHTYVSMNTAGEMILNENVPNSRYLRGTKRAIYEVLDTLLPLCQSMRAISAELVYSPAMPVCAIGISILITLSGIYLFQKKDIK